MTTRVNPLRINVGFLVKAEVGYTRTIEFDEAEMVLPPDLTVYDLRGAATFGRTPQGLVAEVALSGRTTVECVRCLEEFDQAIATQFTDLYAFDERSVTESQLLVPADHHIDLAPLAANTCCWTCRSPRCASRTVRACVRYAATTATTRPVSMPTRLIRA